MNLFDINIKIWINKDIAKIILGNLTNAKKFLSRKWIRSYQERDVWESIVNNWNYGNDKKIIREMFKDTENEKYQTWKNAKDKLSILFEERKKLFWDKITWPFSQWQFDNFVQKINKEKISWEEKDKKVCEAAKKFRRIKEINTFRNDWIEYLIFESYEDIIPTFSHRKRVDFFINGYAYDQKVSRSVTKQFIRDYWPNWKQEALENPEKVVEYLYKYQDEGRFWADRRLYVVFLDEDVDLDQIENQIKSVDFSQPLKIEFSFEHKDFWKKIYKTEAFIILLSSTWK